MQEVWPCSIKPKKHTVKFTGVNSNDLNKQFYSPPGQHDKYTSLQIRLDSKSKKNKIWTSPELATGVLALGAPGPAVGTGLDLGGPPGLREGGARPDGPKFFRLCDVGRPRPPFIVVVGF